MYKDVRKKLLAVVLCVCMIAGIVEVVPRVQAAATVSGNTVSVKGTDPNGVQGDYTIKLSLMDSLTYNGKPQQPKLEYVTDSSGKMIEGSDKWSLVGTGTDVGTYSCYLDVSGNNKAGYAFLQNDTTFTFEIKQATISDLEVTQKSKVVPWAGAEGTAPMLAKVEATLTEGSVIELKEDQYTLSKESDTGAKTSTLTVTDTNNFAVDAPTASIKYTVAYPLSGTIADGTTAYEMSLDPNSTPYDGQPHTPDIRLKDASGWETPSLNNTLEISYYKNGNKVAQMIDAGTYQVVVDFGSVAKAIDTKYYTGKFTGTYTIQAGDTSGLKVVARDEKTNNPATIFEAGSQKETLIYSYDRGTPVQLQEVHIYDGDKEVTDKFQKTWSRDTEVGPATLKLIPTEDSNYTGNIEIIYFITSRLRIDSMTFEGYSAGDYNIYYSGSPIAPKILKVVNDSGAEVAASNYTVTYKYYENGTELTATGATDPKLAMAGKKKVVITGKGNYADAGSVEEAYTVSAVSMENPKYENDFTLTFKDILTDGTTKYLYYTGEAIEPEVELRYKSSLLTKDTDYTVSYSKNTNCGTATVTVTAKSDSNYAGSRDISFEIRPLDLDKIKVVGNAGAANPENAFSYTGSGVQPVLKLKDSNYDYVMTEGEDYDVVAYYKDGQKLDRVPIDCGTYKIEIKNKNSNITGSAKTVEYEIVKRDISLDGDSSFLLTGVNTVVEGSITTRTIEWNGGDTKPEVSCGNMVIERDFDLEYNNCSKPGDAEVVITGKGNYTGKKTIKYTITERKLANENIKATTAVKKPAGSGYQVTIKLKDEGSAANGYVLQETTDYIVSKVTYITEEDATDYKMQLSALPKAGEYEIELSAAGSSNYTGTRTLTVGCGTDISNATWSIVEEELTYDGTPKVPSDIMLVYYDDKGKKQTLPYVANDPETNSPFLLEFVREDDVSDTNATIYAGDVYLIAVANPNLGYFGMTAQDEKGKYTIDPMNLPGTSPKYVINFLNEDGKGTKDANGNWTFPFTNEERHPQIEVVQKADSSIKLNKRDYTVDYSNGCKNYGDYDVIVTGKGNYTGTMKESFTIGQTPINDTDLVKLKWSNVGNATFAEGRPEPVLKLGDYELVYGTDYTYTFDRIEGTDDTGTPVGWNNTYKFTISGKVNFSGEREEYYAVEKTQLDPAQDQDSWQSGQVYINRWNMDELMVDPANIVQKQPVDFALTYKKADGSKHTLEKDVDYEITGYGQNKNPGTDGNTVTVKGINGFTGSHTFTVTLYTDISKAQFITGEGGSTIVPDGTIALSRLEEALKSDDPSAALAKLVSLKNLWREETGGQIDPANYTVSVPGGYTPRIGSVKFMIAGTQQEPRYYAGSIEVPMTVTGALDGEQIRVEIGDNNTVVWDGETITPDNTPVKVYDGNKTLKGGYLAAGGAADPDWDYTVTFSNSSGIGLATATINGINKYSESLTQPFKITYPLSDLVIQIQDDESKWEDYDGGSPVYKYQIDPSKNKPAVKLYYQKDKNDISTRSEISKDLYHVDWNGNDRAGKATININGQTEGDYAGILTGNTRTISYVLQEITEGVKVSMTNRTPYYTGNPITDIDLGLSVTYGTYQLTDADYSLSYESNINSENVNGTQKSSVTIHLKGNFTGKMVETFTILPMPIYSETDISAAAEDLYYTGTAQTPKLTLSQLTGKMRTLKEGEDYEIVCYLNDAKGGESQTPYTAVGDYYVRVRGLGNYAPALNNIRDIPYRIRERQMTDGVDISFVSTTECPVIDGVPVCEYNGEAHEPAVQVVYNGQILNDEKHASTPDYLVTYEHNTDAGLATVTIKGNNSFEGTRTLDFTIKPKDIAGEDMDFRDKNGNAFVDEAEYEWTKTPVQPEISVYDKTMKASLVKGEGSADYTVTYTDYNEDNNEQRNAGKVTITISGTGNYGGTKQFTYYIGEDISRLCALVDGKQRLSATYNGLSQAPEENRITVSGTATVDVVDAEGNKRYRIAYYKDGFAEQNMVSRDEIIDAGTYYIAVVGEPTLGTYAKSSESNSCIYVINPRSISPDYVLVSGYDGTYYYTGQPIEPKGITVEDTALPVDASGAQMRSVKLVNGTDFDLTYSNNLTAGKASIIVTGKGNYTGQRAAFFNIISSTVDGNNTWDGTSEGTGSITNGITTIAASDISLGYDNSTYSYMMYTGYARIPTVYINGVDSNEFVVTASNNINPGVATLTITGKGNNYSGTIIKNFTIKANLAQYGVVNPVADQTYTGYQITPYVTVTCGGNLLNSGSDYTVTYSNNINVGTANVIVNAASDSYYFGSVTGTFNISNTAGGMEITGYASSYTYTGNAISPDVVVMMNGRVLNRGTDYVVSYRNNVNVGMASMTVTGIGSYSGTKTISYAIEARNIENCLTTAVDSYNYTGNTYTPSVTITDSMTGQTLTAGTDYTITYSNNTNPGTATITVTALSRNYTGSKVISFKIKSAAVSGLRASKIRNNRIKLVWSKQSYADGYQICNANNRVIATTDSNSIVVKNLTSCTTYRFKVRSYVENADGSVSYGDFSTAISAKTMLNTPKLKVKSSSKGKVTLTWSKVAKATGYEIYYSTKKNGIYTRLKTVSKSSARKYVDSGLASGEKYYYTIRAYRTANGVKTYSSYNTIKSVKVK